MFNLFVVSVFWSFMADIWREPQARRLFGFIAAGGSAVAVCLGRRQTLRRRRLQAEVAHGPAGR